MPSTTPMVEKAIGSIHDSFRRLDPEPLSENYGPRMAFLIGVRWRIPAIVRTITAADVLDFVGVGAMVYTLGQAAKVAGVSKQRILADRKSYKDPGT